MSFIICKEKDGNTEYVNNAKFPTVESAKKALKEIARDLKAEMKFHEGTEFGGEPAIWAEYVQTADGTEYFVCSES